MWIFYTTPSDANSFSLTVTLPEAVEERRCLSLIPSRNQRLSFPYCLSP